MRRNRFLGAVGADHGKAGACGRGTERADHHAAGDDLAPRRRRQAGEVNPDDALACRAAMLDARDDLLADKAALVEIDAMNEVEIGVVREGFAIGEVGAPLGNAERDAVGLVALGGAGFARRGERVERADEAPAETAVARIAEGRDRIIGPPSLAARPPCGADTRGERRRRRW